MFSVLLHHSGAPEDHEVNIISVYFTVNQSVNKQTQFDCLYNVQISHIEYSPLICRWWRSRYAALDCVRVDAEKMPVHAQQAAAGQRAAFEMVKQIAFLHNEINMVFLAEDLS